MRITTILASLLIALIHTYASANNKVLRIYHDSDYNSHYSSARAMKMGLITALAEVNYKIDEYTIEVVEKDHRGNVLRSLRTMKEYLKDPQALLILGGLHSPPYLKKRTFINQNKILLLVPWAAGGPITRYLDGTNWIFRLSVDDTKAGLRISEFAVKNKHCKSPHLLLEETGWGKSNFNTISQYFEQKHASAPAVTWFNWNTKENGAKVILRQILNSDADCLILVSNAIEGATFIKAAVSLDKFDLPILSHWGITGGDFVKNVGPAALAKIDLHFVQTCFSFVSSAETEFSRAVFKRGQTLFPKDLLNYSSLQSPTGFIHSYDLGRIMIQALKEIELSDDIQTTRARLRDKLEQLSTPVQGLIKTYKQPFSPFSSINTDAHEALGLKDLCMASFTPEGIINVINQHIQK